MENKNKKEEFERRRFLDLLGENGWSMSEEIHGEDDEEEEEDSDDDEEKKKKAGVLKVEKETRFVCVWCWRTCSEGLRLLAHVLVKTPSRRRERKEDL